MVKVKNVELEVKLKATGTSLAVQWLRLPASKAGGVGSVLGGDIRSHMPQGTAIIN